MKNLMKDEVSRMEDMNDNAMDEEVVTLYDEDGNGTDYVVIDGVEYEGKCYLALVEASHIDDEECEFTVLRLDNGNSDSEDGVLTTIEDEDEFNNVMELFEKKLDEEYELEDEDGEPFPEEEDK